MEEKLFGILIENVIGYAHVEVLAEDQRITQYLVTKGTMLTVLSHGEVRITANKFDPPHNYKCLVGHKSITLYCNPSEVYQLTRSEKDLLNGVTRKSERIEVMHNLDWVGKLYFGSFVYVTIPTIPVPVKGLIYYVGPLKGEVGIKFGIELQERRGEGTSDGTFGDVDYFECEPNCAVFVSMDKLTQKSAVDVAKVTSVIKQSSQPGDDKPFRIGDEVTVFDKNGHPINGIVRSVKKNVLGIEARKHLVLADIPGQVEDTKKRSDFTIIQYHHAKLFLPAELVRRINLNEPDTKFVIKKSLAQPRENKEAMDRQKRINEAKDQLKLEDWSDLDVSMLDIERQKKILEEITQTKNLQQVKRVEEAAQPKRLQEEAVQQEQKRLQGEAAQKKRAQEEAAQQIRFQEAAQPTNANALGINAVVIHQDSTTSESHIEQSESNRSDELTDVSSTVNQIHQDVGKMEQKFYAVEGQMKSYIQKSEESLQRMEVNVDNAFRKAIDVQTINKELQVNNVGIQNQLSLTQQQLLDIQKNNERLQASNEHLQSQMLAILDKLSHTQQQFLDMQKSNEQLQKANAHLQDQVSLAKQQLIDVQKNNDLSQANLQNQLSLTQQQLLGVQSMMTCSRLWVVSHDQFTIGREIGRGAWASVHETTFRGAKVAGKRLHDEITSPETIELFHQEMEMALHCQHQNIVTFLGVTLENHPVILMELMDISLRSAYKRGNVKYWQVLKIFYDIASALHFLHTRPDAVIHRDVSSANVLLKDCGNEKWLAKLGDLGTAKLQQYCTTPGPGAFAYAAPEVADPKRHSTKMDVYSFGVLVVEVLTKTLPFQNLNTLKVQIQQQFPQYHRLITSCTNQQSSGRPTMYDAIGQLNKISTTMA